MVSYYCVYKHTFPNGKIYIGITSKNPLLRWKNGRGYQGQKHIYNAILKYGWDNIRHEILFTGLTKEEAEAKEIELIAEYKSNNREYGYNHAIGGGVNKGFHFTLSEEIKNQISERMKVNKNGGRQDGEHNAFYGHHHTEEARKKISEAQYKPVLQFDKRGNYIAEYSTPYNAEVMTGIRHIRECAIGKRKTAGGFIWRYKLSEFKDW